MFNPPDAADHLDPGADRGGGSEGDAWMVTWADAITLLLGFFVLMFSLSDLESLRYDEILEGLTGERTVHQPIPSEAAQTRTGPELAARMNQILGDTTFAGPVRVERLPAGVVVELRAADLFTSGDQLDPDVERTLATLAWEIGQPNMDDYLVDIQSLDQLEQGGPRALALMRFLQVQGVSPERMRATAFGAQGPRIRRDRGRSLGVPADPTIRLLLERP